jgi:uncharacterized membrane protein
MYLYLLLIIICWSINPFFKKYITKSLNSIEYNCANNMCILCMIFCIIFYLNFIKTNSNKISINFLNKLNRQQLTLLIFSSFLTLLPSFLFIHVLKDMDVSFVVPFTQSLTIVCSTIIGVLVMNEKFSLKIGLGITSIIIGIGLLTNK